MQNRQTASEKLSHDPIHGYIRFVATPAASNCEICECNLIDNPWVQRMRQIRQLQTAWWVFPSAEHSRFQHILGVMHVASLAVDRLYPTLAEIDPQTPSKAYVDLLLRMSGLLHDVGHGPFGHFFDAHFLNHYGLTHETLGALIIQRELGSDLAQLRSSPCGELAADERLDPQQIAWLIQRPRGKKSGSDASVPKWLEMLRSLFCGIYTVDNMDFVLRDAYMTGLNPRAFDLPRLLHYSFFSEHGLTINERGMSALVHFLAMKAELFRNVYFHRTVRAIDLALEELFRDSHKYLMPGNPAEHLDAYQGLTEFSLLTDVRRWRTSKQPKLYELGQRWTEWLERKIPWTMVCQRNLSFAEDQPETSSIFSSARILSASVRDRLSGDLKSLPFQVDLARHIHRPHTLGATAGMNFYQDSVGSIRPLPAHGLYRRLPISHTIARIYARDQKHAHEFSAIMDELVGNPGDDDLTNM